MTHFDVLRQLATVLERDVNDSQRDGHTPLLDGIEMSRLIRAIADQKPTHRPQLGAAQARFDAVVLGQTVRVIAPNIEWPIAVPTAIGDA